jgi:site-specific DNA recombinase
MKFAAIYGRSSLGKAKQGDTVEHQVDMIKEFVKRTNIDVIFDDRFIYEDDGESGFKTTLLQRPAMRKLLNDIDNELIGTVFFKGVSRFARDSGEAITTAKRLTNKGVRVISLEENYDSFRDEPTFFQLYSVLAESESRKTSIRVSLGNKQKARNGLWSGSITPLGFTKIKDIKNEELKQTLLSQGKHKHSLYPDEYAFIIQKIFQMFVQEGMGRKKIASYLNENAIKTNQGKDFQEKHILDILRNQAYIGNIVYGKTRYNYIEDDNKSRKIQHTVKIDESDWVITENAHPNIVERELFQKAQEILDQKKGMFEFGRQFNAAKHPLTGLIRCDKCNSPMICQKRTNKKKDGTKLEYRYYVCSLYHKSGRVMCDQANVNADGIENLLYNFIKKTFEEKMKDWNYEKSIQEKEETSKDLKNNIKQLDNILQKKLNAVKTLLESREFYDTETFISLNSELQNEIKKLRSQKEQIENKIKSLNEENGGIDLSEEFELFKGNIPDDLSARRDIFHRLLNEVKVRDKQVVYIDTKVKLPLNV